MEVGILKGMVTQAVIAALFATPILARQMECSYDYVTHVTTLQLNDLGVSNGPISYSYTHSISPKGGEVMFLFDGSDATDLKGSGQLEFIEEKLYFDPQATISAIEFVDFERPTLKQLQTPASYLEQPKDTINAPLVVWSCKRID